MVVHAEAGKVATNVKRVAFTGKDVQGQPISRDNLIAWPKIASEHELIGLMFEWTYAGATLHPWDTSSFKRQQPFTR